MNFSAALADLADQARMYADPDRAIGAARRRRRTRMAASACAAAVAVVLGGMSFLPGGAERDAVPPRLRALYPAKIEPRPDAPYLSTAGAGAATRLPDQLPGIADQLPNDAGGEPSGTAALLYAPCPRGDCWPNLVLPDGTQYRVPEGPDGVRDGQPWDVTLSPDGRYAGWRYRDKNGSYHVVDLRTGAKTGVGEARSQFPVSAWVWSPDSNRLLLAEHHDGNVARYFMLDMRDPPGGYRQLPASVAGPDGSVVGIRNNGDLLVWVGDSGGQLPVLRVVTPVTSWARTLPPPAAGGLLAEGERVLGLLNSPCDCQVWFTVYAPGETGRPTALLGMDLTDGHLTGRIDLPRSAESGGHNPGVWEARASLPGGIALVHHHPGGTDIEILNDVNGERVVVTRIEADAHVVLRGQARY